VTEIVHEIVKICEFLTDADIMPSCNTHWIIIKNISIFGGFDLYRRSSTESTDAGDFEIEMKLWDYMHVISMSFPFIGK
jgi:hypothetical protein